MEVHTKYGSITFKNTMLALFFLGIIIIIISAFLSAELDEEFINNIRTIGGLTSFISFCILATPYVLDLIQKYS